MHIIQELRCAQVHLLGHLAYRIAAQLAFAVRDIGARDEDAIQPQPVDVVMALFFFEPQLADQGAVHPSA